MNVQIEEVEEEDIEEDSILPVSKPFLVQKAL
jgi:hypothetical protein